MEDAGIILDKDITPSVETKKVGFPEIESEFASLSLNELEEALTKQSVKKTTNAPPKLETR